MNYAELDDEPSQSMLARANKAGGYPARGTNAATGLPAGPETWDGQGATPPGWTRAATYRLVHRTTLGRYIVAIPDDISAQLDALDGADGIEWQAQKLLLTTSVNLAEYEDVDAISALEPRA